MGDHRHTYKASGEQMEVSLGTDGEIKIDRNAISLKDKSGTLLDSKQHLKRGYVITVQNTAKKTKRIVIRENIPVSKIEDIKIELLEKETTEGYKLDQERGFLSWTLTLRPNQSRNISLYYSIHLPESWKTQ